MTKKLLLATVFGGCLLPAAAQAQQAPLDDDDLDADEIVVVGTRAALEESALAKRNADNFIEAITSDDIGTLPDTSIAEALERVVGVVASTDRGRAAAVVVRGLSPDLTLTTFNGRELASESANRSIQLGLFPAEIISRAQVIKSPSADLVENGLAGTVNLGTRSGLDLDERVITGNLRAIISDMPDFDDKSNTGWRGSVTYLDQFANDTIGVAASFAYQDDVNFVQDAGLAAEAQPLSFFQFDQTRPNNRRGFGDIDGNGIVDVLPRVGLLNNEGTDTERFGGVLDIEWAPTDDTSVRFDGLYTERTDDTLQQRARIITLFSAGAGPNGGNGGFFDLSDGAFVTDPSLSGNPRTLAGDTVQTELVRQFTVANNGRIRADGIARDFNSTILSLGGTAEHNIDRWTLSGEVAYSEAERENQIVEVTATRNAVGYTYSDLGNVPQFTNIVNGPTGDPLDLDDPTLASINNNGVVNLNSGFGPELYAEANNQVSDELFSTRFDVAYDLDKVTFKSIQAGARYFDRKKLLRRDRDTLFQLPPGARPNQGRGQRLGPLFNNVFSVNQDAEASLAALQGAIRPFPSSSFLGGDVGINSFFLVDPIAVQNARLAEFAATNAGVAQDPNDPVLNGFLNFGRDAGDFTRDTFDVDEEAIAGYVKVDFDNAIGSVPVRGNAGIRVVSSKTTSTLVRPQFTVSLDESGSVEGVQALPLIELPDGTTDIQFEEISNKYTNVLPSFNIVGQLSPSLQLRGAIAKTITRPLYSDLGRTLQILGSEPDDEDAVQIVGRSGNPELDPFSAWQYDLGFGYYRSRDFNLTGTVFYKDVDGFIVNQPGTILLSDANGVQAPVVVNQPVNREDSTFIAGVELAYFQNFRFLPGFLSNTGLAANYTYLDTNAEDQFLLSVTDGNGLTPNGVGCDVPNPNASGRICNTVIQKPDSFAAHAANAQFFYDDRTLDVRLALRYKSETPEQFQDFARLRQDDLIVDLSGGYNINQNLRLLANVTNLTNSKVRRNWVDYYGTDEPGALQAYREFGRRYTVGARVRF